jgi:hypothetical protein
MTATYKDVEEYLNQNPESLIVDACRNIISKKAEPPKLKWQSKRDIK